MPGNRVIPLAAHTAQLIAVWLTEGQSGMNYVVNDFASVSPEDLPLLTGRECEVLKCVALGLSNKEAAIELGIAPRTVERHIENLRNKIRARNRAHMVAKAIGLGVLRNSGENLAV